MAYVRKIIAKDENLIGIARLHWIYVVKGLFWFLVMAGAGWLFNSAISHVVLAMASTTGAHFIPAALMTISNSAMYFMMAGGFMIFFLFVLKVLVTEVALSSRRVIEKTGLIFVKVRQIDIEEIRGENLDLGHLGRFLGYGYLFLDCRFIGDVRLPAIENPERFLRALHQARTKTQDSLAVVMGKGNPTPVSIAMPQQGEQAPKAPQPKPQEEARQLDAAEPQPEIQPGQPEGQPQPPPEMPTQPVPHTPPTSPQPPIQPEQPTPQPTQPIPAPPPSEPPLQPPSSQAADNVVQSVKNNVKDMRQEMFDDANDAVDANSEIQTSQPSQPVPRFESAPPQVAPQSQTAPAQQQQPQAAPQKQAAPAASPQNAPIDPKLVAEVVKQVMPQMAHQVAQELIDKGMVEPAKAHNDNEADPDLLAEFGDAAFDKDGKKRDPKDSFEHALH